MLVGLHLPSPESPPSHRHGVHSSLRSQVLAIPRVGDIAQVAALHEQTHV